MTNSHPFPVCFISLHLGEEKEKKPSSLAPWITALCVELVLAQSTYL